MQAFLIMLALVIYSNSKLFSATYYINSNINNTVNWDLNQVDKNHRILTGNSGATLLSFELLTFTATPGTNRVSVNWTTSTENNNDYFTVEKSINGIDFEKVEIIKGAGNSSGHLDYSLVDEYPFFGLSYYRLKQTDFDGKYSYSAVVSVEFTNEGIDDFNVYPNPNNGETVNVSISAETNKEILVEVYDINGKKAFSKIVVTNSDGKNIYAIDFNQKLAPGVYFITATSNQSIYNKRLIVK